MEVPRGETHAGADRAAPAPQRRRRRERGHDAGSRPVVDEGPVATSTAPSARRAASSASSGPARPQPATKTAPACRPLALEQQGTPRLRPRRRRPRRSSTAPGHDAVGVVARGEPLGGEHDGEQTAPGADRHRRRRPEQARAHASTLRPVRSPTSARTRPPRLRRRRAGGWPRGSDASSPRAFVSRRRRGPCACSRRRAGDVLRRRAPARWPP